MIDLLPNITVLYQWVIFMIALLTLHFGVFKPVLRILNERKAKTTGAKENAIRLQHRSDEILDQCEKKIEQARTAGMRKREERLQSAEKIKEELLKNTRDEIDERLEKVHHQIEVETKEATLQLNQYAQQMGHEIASKLLEREI